MYKMVELSVQELFFYLPLVISIQHLFFNKLSIVLPTIGKAKTLLWVFIYRLKHLKPFILFCKTCITALQLIQEKLCRFSKRQKLIALRMKRIK